MVVVRLVPWLNYDEYVEVYKLLYPEDGESLGEVERLELRMLGVKRVRAWSQRCRLPTHVEATRALMEAYINEKTINQACFNEYDLRLMYSMAIIRFVNYIIDPVSIATKVRSMQKVADKLHFPQHFIQLRHQATHQSLPPLHVLRARLAEGIEWLDRHCWSVSSSQEIYHKEDVKLWIASYKQFSKTTLKEEASLEKEELVVSVWLKDNLIVTDSGLFLSLLLEEGNLIPLRKKKRPLLHRLRLSEDHVQVWSPLIFELVDRDPQFLSLLTTEILSKILLSNLKMSRPLQSLLLSRGVLSEQWQEVNSQDDSYYITLTAWLIQLFDWKLQEVNETFKELSIDEVTSVCLKHPNPYFLKVLDYLRHHFHDSLAELDPHIQLATDTFAATEFDREFPEDNVSKARFLVERSKRILEREVLSKDLSFESQKVQLAPEPIQSNITLDQPNSRQMAETDDIHPWRKLNESNWQPCPIGFISREIPDLNLPLEWDNYPDYVPAYLQSDLQPLP